MPTVIGLLVAASALAVVLVAISWAGRQLRRADREMQQRLILNNIVREPKRGVVIPMDQRWRRRRSDQAEPEFLPVNDFIP